MDVGYNEGSFLALWYDGWIVLIGFVAALVLVVMVAVRLDWRSGAVRPNSTLMLVMVLAVLAGLPLTMTRLSIDLAITNYDTVGIISILGTAVALVVGVTFIVRQNLRDRERLGDVIEESATGQDGMTVGFEPEAGGEAGTLLGDATPPPGGDAPTMASTAWLHFQTGPMAGQSIPIGPGALSIGRGDENDVVLDDATVSRHHAQVTYQDGQYFIEDAGSMSGTLVEGMQATRTLLASGATLQMGESEFMFMQAESPSMTAAGTGMQGPAETVVMVDQAQGVMAWLAVTAGPQKGRAYQLKVGDNTIGRGTENDLVIEDGSMSRRHAAVKVQDDEFLLVDLGSRGGTRVAGKTLEGRPLASGGVVGVGKTKLRLVEVEEGQPSAQPVSASGETMIQVPGGAVVACSLCSPVRTRVGTSLWRRETT